MWRISGVISFRPEGCSVPVDLVETLAGVGRWTERKSDIELEGKIKKGHNLFRLERRGNGYLDFIRIS